MPAQERRATSSTRSSSEPSRPSRSSAPSRLSRPPLKQLVATAVEDFADLTGQPVDRVSGVRRTEDGWSLLVDVVDVERVPATTSVLSTFRVDADGEGNLTGYERIRRFTRASTDGR